MSYSQMPGSQNELLNTPSGKNFELTSPDSDRSDLNTAKREEDVVGPENMLCQFSECETNFGSNCPPPTKRASVSSAPPALPEPTYSPPTEAPPPTSSKVSKAQFSPLPPTPTIPTAPDSGPPTHSHAQHPTLPPTPTIPTAPDSVPPTLETIVPPPHPPEPTTQPHLPGKPPPDSVSQPPTTTKISIQKKILTNQPNKLTKTNSPKIPVFHNPVPADPYAGAKFGTKISNTGQMKFTPTFTHLKRVPPAPLSFNFLFCRKYISKNKPFSCHIRNKTFTIKNPLRTHEQTHPSDKPISCDKRGKTFALKSYLHKHKGTSCPKQNRDPVQKMTKSENTENNPPAVNMQRASAPYSTGSTGFSRPGWWTRLSPWPPSRLGHSSLLPKGYQTHSTVSSDKKLQ